MIDQLDWALVINNKFSDLSGFTQQQAYELGDVNYDGFNNELDFVLFQDAHNAAHGAGAFDAMISGASEPSTAVLLALGIAPLLRLRRRR